MKSTKNLLLIIIALLIISAAHPFRSTHLLAKDFVVTIHGTSNLHDWDEKVGIVTGDCSIIPANDGSFDLEAITIKMNVHSIKSTKGSVMNNNTYKALKADAHPEIIFVLSVPVKSFSSKQNEKLVSAKGKLSIAGVTKTVDMKVKVYMKELGKSPIAIRFEGSQAVKMTDYGIDPPKALLGTLKTGNEIIIKFKIGFEVAGK